MFRSRSASPILASAFFFLFLALPLKAAEPDIRIHDPYVRLPPPGAMAVGAFMRIENAGSAERKLIKAASPAAKTVELHTHINDNGVMKMRAVSAIPIPAKGQAQLKPGGDHIMLIGLKAALQEGRDVPITLYFDDGSHLTVMAPIKKPSAGSPTPNGTMKH